MDTVPVARVSTWVHRVSLLYATGLIGAFTPLDPPDLSNEPGGVGRNGYRPLWQAEACRELVGSRVAYDTRQSPVSLEFYLLSNRKIYKLRGSGLGWLPGPMVCGTAPMNAGD